MNKMWQSLPDSVRSYLEILASMWMSAVGLAAITWGVALMFPPAGYIVGGFSALLLDRAIDMTLTRGGRR
jgi:hypothetical protein